MSNQKRIVIAAVAVVAVIAGAAVYALFAANNTVAPEASEHTPSANAKVASVITYDGSSFSLSSSTVSSGSAVKITNNSSDELDFDSDPHPVHTDNPELNAGSIAPKESKTITLTKKRFVGLPQSPRPFPARYDYRQVNQPKRKVPARKLELFDYRYILMRPAS